MHDQIAAPIPLFMCKPLSVFMASSWSAGAHAQWSDSPHWPGHADKDTRCDGGPGGWSQYTRCDGGPGEDGHNQGWRLGALHDVQHPAQNTRPAPGTGQTLAAISMGREGDWRDSKCHGEQGERERQHKDIVTR